MKYKLSYYSNDINHEKKKLYSIIHKCTDSIKNLKKKYVVGIYKPNDVDPFSKLLTPIIILQHAIMIGDFFF